MENKKRKRGKEGEAEERTLQRRHAGQSRDIKAACMLNERIKIKSNMCSRNECSSLSKVLSELDGRRATTCDDVFHPQNPNPEDHHHLDLFKRNIAKPSQKAFQHVGNE
jgi:hypothetical protein